MSSFWSTVLCIRVLKAIMPIWSKIGLILSKGGREQVLPGRHFIYILGFDQVWKPKSRRRQNISKLWSSLLCIRVLRAIMTNLSKIGLILSRGGQNRFCQVGIFGTPAIWPLLPLPSAGGVRVVAENNPRWKPFLPSLQRWKPHCTIFLSSREIKVFLWKKGILLVIFALIHCVLEASAYRNHLLSCVPLLNS